MNFKSAQSYLDVGCSNGYLTDEVSKSLGIPQSVGMDYDPNYVAEAQKNYPHLSFVYGSITDPPRSKLPVQRFDLVTCFETLEHVGNYEKAFDELIELTSQTGVLILSVPIETGATGLFKLLTKYYVYNYGFEELGTNFYTYLRYFVRGEISLLREPGKKDWGTHFGFDWRTIATLIEAKSIPYKTYKHLTSKIFVIDKGSAPSLTQNAGIPRFIQKPSKRGLFILSKFIRFFLTSGIGWLLDMGTFSLLVELGSSVMISACVGSVVGVFFVYYASLKLTFLSASKADHQKKVFIFFAFQTVSILFYSYLISVVQNALVNRYGLEANTLVSLGAKILVTPLSLITNYIFLQQLVERFSFSKKHHVD